MRYPPICKKYTIELSDLVITKILHAVKTTIVKLRNLFILAAIAGLFAVVRGISAIESLKEALIVL